MIPVRFRVSALLVTSLVLIMGACMDLHADLTWHDQHRIGQIVLLSLVALGVATIWRNQLLASLDFISRRFLILFGAAFLLGVVSAFNSEFPRFAVLEWVTFFLLVVLMFLLAYQAFFEAKVFDRFSTYLIISLVTIITLKIVMSYLAAIIEIKRLDTIMLFESSFSNRRFFGQVATIIIPFLAYPLVSISASNYLKIGASVLLTIWWTLIYASGTRGAWAALFVTVVVMVIVGWYSSQQFIKIQFLAAAKGLLCFLILFHWLPDQFLIDASVENRFVNISSLSGRDVLWSLAWEQIKSHPWLGIGPMHLAAIHNNFGAHPHSSILQLAAEWGVPAASAFFVIFLIGLAKFLKKIQQYFYPVSNLLICLTASLLASGLQSLVDGVIVMPYMQILLSLFMGWALGVYMRFEQDKELSIQSPCKHESYLVILLSILSLSMLLFGVFPEILNRPEITHIYENSGILIPPRYWAVGWIP